jgi:hypothetical protein
MAGRDLVRVKLMLRLAAVRRYVALPIPAEEDTLVEEFISDWRSGSSSASEALSALDSVKGFLGAFAVRAASRGVRAGDIESVRLGFWALCVAGWEEDDYREFGAIAAVLIDACRRLGVEPEIELGRVLPEARGDAARILSSFAKALPGGVALGDYRVHADADESGFRYRWGWERAA